MLPYVEHAMQNICSRLW